MLYGAVSVRTMKCGLRLDRVVLFAKTTPGFLYFRRDPRGTLTHHRAQCDDGGVFKFYCFLASNARAGSVLRSGAIGFEWRRLIPVRVRPHPGEGPFSRRPHYLTGETYKPMVFYTDPCLANPLPSEPCNFTNLL
jgi:hypothetical protein